jgi:phosphotransferase system IIB component
VISIFAEVDIENDKLILGSCYSGVGEENCDLFHVKKDKKEVKIHGITIGNEPISMGYSLNLVMFDDKTVIFGTLSDKDYDYKNDVMNEVNYTEIEVIFNDGLVEKQNIKNQDGYIVVGETTSKIETIILYQDNEVSAMLDELLEYDEIVNRVEFSEDIEAE